MSDSYAQGGVQDSGPFQAGSLLGANVVSASDPQSPVASVKNGILTFTDSSGQNHHIPVANIPQRDGEVPTYQSPEEALSAMTNKGKTKENGGIYGKNGKREKPDWVLQAEQRDGIPYTFDEKAGKWVMQQ